MKKNDIGLVVGTNRQALFMRVRDVKKEVIKNAEEDIEVWKEDLKRAEEIIKEEKNAH